MCVFLGAKWTWLIAKMDYLVPAAPGGSGCPTETGAESRDRPNQQCHASGTRNTDRVLAENTSTRGLSAASVWFDLLRFKTAPLEISIHKE